MLHCDNFNEEKIVSGKWCPRREWSSPPDAQRAATDARRGVLYSSVFLGSPGKSSSSYKFEISAFFIQYCIHVSLLIKIVENLFYLFELFHSLFA